MIMIVTRIMIMIMIVERIMMMIINDRYEDYGDHYDSYEDYDASPESLAFLSFQYSQTMIINVSMRTTMTKTC